VGTGKDDEQGPGYRLCAATVGHLTALRQMEVHSSMAGVEIGQMCTLEPRTDLGEGTAVGLYIITHLMVDVFLMICLIIVSTGFIVTCVQHVHHLQTRQKLVVSGTNLTEL
jgi:hypothetical protein